MASPACSGAETQSRARDAGSAHEGSCTGTRRVGPRDGASGLQGKLDLVRVLQWNLTPPFNMYDCKWRFKPNGL